MSGMFPQSLVDAARGQGHVLESARERYLPFKFYPLREHVALLFEIAPLLFPQMSMRRGLRKIGRAAPKALLNSTVGRVVLASTFEPHVAVDSFVRAYNINMKSGTAELSESGPDWAVVRLTRINFLSDCHQVGTLEGFLRHVGVRTEVAFNELGSRGTEYLLRW